MTYICAVQQYVTYICAVQLYVLPKVSSITNTATCCPPVQWEVLQNQRPLWALVLMPMQATHEEH